MVPAHQGTGNKLGIHGVDGICNTCTASLSLDSRVPLEHCHVVPMYLIGCKAAVRSSKADLIKIPLWDGSREVVVVESQSMQMLPGTAINATVRLWHRPAEVVLLADKTQSSKKALQMLVLFLSCYCSPAPPTFSPISTTGRRHPHVSTAPDMHMQLGMQSPGRGISCHPIAY